MLIDWFTVGAQAINFLVLVLLMWRFLYKPILHAIDEREKRICAELSDADAKRAEARRERDEYQQKNQVLDEQRAKLLSQATEEANGELQRLLLEARKKADALNSKWQQTLRNDAHNLNQAIGNRAQKEVFAIARKALAELAGANLEERLADVFIRRVGEMEAPAKASLGEALRTATEPAVLRSAFDLPGDHRAAIQNAIDETFSAPVRLRFETAPNLVSGIELTANGLRVGWSIAEYLTSLEAGIRELLEEKDGRNEEVGQKAGANANPRTSGAALGPVHA